jgi:ABC-type multidrug transport system fused ATPase/permease subunit
MAITGHFLYCFMLFYFLFYTDGDLRTFTLLFYVILWLGITEVLEGNLTIGAFIAFRMYSNYVVEPVIRLAQIWQDFQYT